MGQAKQRGTFEQRQAEGMAKRKAEERRRLEAQTKRDAELAEREAIKTPEDRDRSRRAGLLLTSILGAVVASSTAKWLELARMAAEYRDR